MIRGYPRRPGTLPGETLTLHVSTDQPFFRVEAYRQGAELRSMGALGPARLAGHDVPAGAPDQDWRWPGYELPIPADWPSGVYIAMLIAIDADGTETLPDLTTADGQEAKALFVVKSDRPGSTSPILHKIALATYHAYNGTGYGSLYAEAVWSRGDTPPGYKVTLRRPGGGTGGTVMPGDAPDFYDPSTRRQTFAHWEAPFIAWLEANGYQPEYCTDFDLHEDPELLAPYRLLLSVGHDEYWSLEMRAQVERFIANGGNVAFFSGNTCWWRIHVVDEGAAIICDKATRVPNVVSGRLGHWWTDRPENSVTGVSYRNGGGWWNGRRDALGYTVQHADHWVYRGTGLSDGQTFGADEGFPLLGYECDGAAFTRQQGLAVATGEDGTPRDFLILGVAELGPGWSVVANASGYHAATMGLYTSAAGGIVFTGATTDWPRLLDRDPVVAGVTRNVVDRLTLPSVRIGGPLPACYGHLVGVAGETATFVVDPVELPGGGERRYDWEVAGGSAEPVDGPTVRVTMPSPPRPVTVSVTILEGDRPIAFGTRSYTPLSAEEYLAFEFLSLMREMVLPGEPSNPFADGASNPLDKISLATTPRLKWIIARAARLQEIGQQLIAVKEARAEPGQVL